MLALVLTAWPLPRDAGADAAAQPSNWPAEPEWAEAWPLFSFTPLAVERYFLACPRSALRTPGLTTLLRLLRSAEFAAQAAAVPGYIARHAGKRVSLEAALAWVKRPTPSPRP